MPFCHETEVLDGPYLNTIIQNLKVIWKKIKTKISGLCLRGFDPSIIVLPISRCSLCLFHELLPIKDECRKPRQE